MAFYWLVECIDTGSVIVVADVAFYSLVDITWRTCSDIVVVVVIY